MRKTSNVLPIESETTSNSELIALVGIFTFALGSVGWMVWGICHQLSLMFTYIDM